MALSSSFLLALSLFRGGSGLFGLFGLVLGRFGREIGHDGVELTAEFATGVSADDFVEPAGVGFGVLGGDNLNDVALVKLGFEVDHLAVHDGAGTAGADFAMEAIGEVERHGTFGEIEDVTLRGVDENFIGEEVDFELFEVDLLPFAKTSGSGLKLSDPEKISR